MSSTTQKPMKLTYTLSTAMHLFFNKHKKQIEKAQKKGQNQKDDKSKTGNSFDKDMAAEKSRIENENLTLQIQKYNTMYNFFLPGTKYVLSENAKADSRITPMETQFTTLAETYKQLKNNTSAESGNQKNELEKKIGNLLESLQSAETYHAQLKAVFKKQVGKLIKYGKTLERELYKDEIYAQDPKRLEKGQYEKEIENSFAGFLSLSKLIKTIDGATITALENLKIQGLNLNTDSHDKHIIALIQTTYTSLARSADKLCKDCMKLFRNGSATDLEQKLTEWNTKATNKLKRLKTNTAKDDKESTANGNEDLRDAWEKGRNNQLNLEDQPNIDQAQQLANQSSISGNTCKNPTALEGLAEKSTEITIKQLGSKSLINCCTYENLKKQCTSESAEEVNIEVLGMCDAQLQNLIPTLSAYTESLKNLKKFNRTQKILSVFGSVKNFLKENAIIIASIGCLTSFFNSTVGIGLASVIAGITLLACTWRLMSHAKKHLLQERSSKIGQEVTAKIRKKQKQTTENDLRDTKLTEKVNQIVKTYEDKLTNADSDTITIKKEDLELLLKRVRN